MIFLVFKIYFQFFNFLKTIFKFFKIIFMFFILWYATCPRLHSQQLPRGKRPFSNNYFFLQGRFSIFFCRDENQNSPKLQRRKSYLSHFFFAFDKYYE